MPPYLSTLCHLLLQSFSHSSCHTGGGGEEGGHGDLCAVRLRGDVGSQHRKGGGRACLRVVRHPCSSCGRLTPCSFGLSATSQQYFSLRTNQPPATSQQYFSLRTNQHQPSAKRIVMTCHAGRSVSCLWRAGSQMVVMASNGC
jgi:hypothetical protein